MKENSDFCGSDPNLFIVGAPRCGTAALTQYLSEHPDIFMSSVKEPNHFAVDFLKPGKGWALRTNYLSLFKAVKNEKVVGESSVLYLYSEVAAREIHNFNPEAKIVIMLRNPVDFLESYHAVRCFCADEDIKDIVAALGAEDDRRSGKRIPKKCHWPSMLYYKKVACFSAQVRRFLDIFPKEQVHIILFDNFQTDTRREYENVLNFVGVKPCGKREFPVINSNRKVHLAFFRDIVRTPPRWLEVPVATLLPRKFRLALKDLVKRLNTRYAPRKKMPIAFRLRLLEEFRDEIDALGQILDQDLSAWKT